MGTHAIAFTGSAILMIRFLLEKLLVRE